MIDNYKNVLPFKPRSRPTRVKSTSSVESTSTPRPQTAQVPERAEPTVQLCLNDAELDALQTVLEALPIVQNAVLVPLIIKIRDGDYIRLDGSGSPAAD